MEVNIDAAALSTHFRELQQGISSYLIFFFNRASLKSNTLSNYHFFLLSIAFLDFLINP